MGNPKSGLIWFKSAVVTELQKRGFPFEVAEWLVKNHFAGHLGLIWSLMRQHQVEDLDTIIEQCATAAVRDAHRINEAREGHGEQGSRRSAAS